MVFILLIIITLVDCTRVCVCFCVSCICSTLIINHSWKTLSVLSLLTFDLCAFFPPVFRCISFFFPQKYGSTDIFINGFIDDLTSVESSYETSINNSYCLTLQHNDRREKLHVGNSV